MFFRNILFFTLVATANLLGNTEKPAERILPKINIEFEPGILGKLSSSKKYLYVSQEMKNFITQSSRLALSTAVSGAALYFFVRPGDNPSKINTVRRTIQKGFKLYDDNKNGIHLAGILGLLTYFGKDGLQSAKEFLGYGLIIKGPAWAAAFNANKLLKEEKPKEQKQ